MPFTPGRLSTTMTWPRVLAISAAKARPIWSVALPAAKGTIALMGLVGQVWAGTTVLNRDAAARTASERKGRRTVVSIGCADSRSTRTWLVRDAEQRPHREQPQQGP